MVFLEEINIWKVDLVKHIALLNADGPHSIHWWPEKEQKAE